MHATRKAACDDITAGVVLKTSEPWLSGLLLATYGFSFPFTFFMVLLWRSGDTWKETGDQIHGYRVLIRQCGSASMRDCVCVCLCVCV